MGWLGFTLLLFYAIVIGGGWLGMYSGPVRLLNLAIVGIGLVIWLIVAWRRPAWRPTTAIWPAFVAPIAAFGISITFSQHQRIGLDFLAYAVLLTALYLLLVRIMALPYARARIGGVMAAMAVVLGAAYLFWTVQLWIEWWDLVGELRMPPLRPALLGMTWGSPSVVFTVLTLLTAAAIGGLGLATRGARLTALVLVLMLAATAFVSGSRSGWLALGGTIAIVGVLALLDARGRDLLSRAWASRAFRLALIPLVIVGGLVAIALGPTVLTRLGAGDAGRLTFWATAVRMFEDAPVVGLGPGTWMIARTAYTEPGEIDLYQPHAHGQYFQTAAELGLVGLVAGIIAFGTVLWLLIPALRGFDAERRRWAWASLFGLVYLALNVVVDVHTIPTVALLMGLPIAVLDATSARGIGLPGVSWRVSCWLRNAAAVLLVLACSAAMLQLIRSEGTALTHQEAVRAAAAGEWSDALAPALEAVRADPDIGVYQLTAALALAANGEWEAAEEAYRHVVSIDGLPDAWLGLARAGVETGRPLEDIKAELAEALRLGEQQAALAFAAGEVYDLAGLPTEAEAAYATALALLPSLGSDREWAAALGPDRFTAVVDAAIEEDPEKAWLIALVSGDGARAQQLVAARPESDAAFAEPFIAAWEGDPEAYTQVRALADSTPTDGERLAYGAQLAEHLGDGETAKRYRRLKRIGAHWGPATVTAGYGQRDPFTDSAMGTSTHFYGTYTYRRALPLDRLPPGLPGIVIVGGEDEAEEGTD